jgi:accessory gene regulator B
MEKLVDLLIKHEIIDGQEADLYLYGFKQLLIIAAHLITYAVIAYLYHEVGLLIVFLVFFIPLRSFAGGYHTASQLTCFLVSVTTIISVLTVLKVDMIGLAIYCIMATVSYVIIATLAPRESDNKPYEDDDKSLYRKKSLWILNAEALIAISMVCFQEDKLFACMSLTFFLIAVLLMVDWIGQNNRKLRS